MSGLQRAFRHPDRTNDPHARARRLVSDRFLEPLAGPDAEWLDGHLDSCAPCRRLAADWAADREALRSLDGDALVPPRNLGARLAAALDGEEAQARRARRAGWAPNGRAGGSSRVPAMSMALVAAVAVLALAILPVLAPFGTGPFGPAAPAATPILVAAAPVAWARSDQGGRTVVQAAVVDRVCPGTDTAVCGTLDDGARPMVTLDLQPTQVILPPTGDRAIAVGPTGVYTFVIPGPGEGVTPSPPSSSLSPTHALPTPTATEVPASPPAGTPAPSESPPATPTVAIPSTEAPASTIPGSGAPASPSPTGTPAPGETLTPATPAPVAATALAIIDGVVLVGAAPAYSPDGRWLAFSARPVGGERGPDVYAWKAGDERARRLTSTGASVFSGWLGDRILGSTVDVVGQSPASAEPAEPTEPAAAVPSPSAAADDTSAVGEAPSTDPGARAASTGSAAAEQAAAPAAVSTEAPPPAAPRTDRGTATATPAATETPAPAETAGSSETPAPAETAGPSVTPAASAAPATPAPPEPGASPEPSAEPGVSAAPSAGPSTEPSASPGPHTVAFSFLLEPASGALEQLPRPGVWRPVVDPSGTTVIYFTGRFAWSDADATWVPASGSLVVAPWADVIDPERPLDSVALPGMAGHPGKMQDWNVRWSGSGDHLAVWLADEDSTSTGRLGLYATDAEGRPTDVLLDGTAALPAFSIDAARLVWATPPGADGEGNRIGVFAWGGPEPGAVYSMPQPGEGVVVVR